jgi:hypothetical protein
MFKRLGARIQNIRERVVNRLYILVSPVYERIFAAQLKPDLYSLSSQDVLSEFVEFNEFDRQLNYFVLHASFGDKWFILSLIQAHLDYYPASRVIAAATDRGLVELFVGKEVAVEKFIFIEQAALNRLSSYFRPISKVSTQIADSWFAPGCLHTVTPYLLQNGLPAGTIRHLHLCYYPYFNELFNLHAVGYITLLRTLLYLPFSAKPAMPEFYSEADFRAVEEIANSPTASEDSRPALLFNVVSFSHTALSLEHVSTVVSVAESMGFRVLVNAAQSQILPDLHSVLSAHRHSTVVSVPPRLVALVSDKVCGVIGALGGAMSIAAQFSRSHLLSLQTPALGTGCAEEDLFAGKAKRNLWKLADQDWPCLHPGRIMQNVYVGDPAVLPCEKLAATTRAFLQEVTLASADAQRPSPC